MINSKLVNVFAVCLITLIIIFPSLTVFGLIWEKHLEFVTTRENISTYKQTISNECSASSLQTDYFINNDYSKLYTSNEKKLEKNQNLSEKHQIRNLGRWLFLFVPFCIGTAIYFYDRYLVYRQAIFQQQVEMLEKLWQQSLEK